MITIVCDNCERTFEVADEDAGGKVKCPMCGDVNRVPAAAATTAAGESGEPRPGPKSDAWGGHLPSDEGPEQPICDIRPAMFRAHPFRALLIAVLFLGGLALSWFAGSREAHAILVWAALAPSLLAVIWAVSWWISAHMWIKLSISNKRTVQHEGIVTRRTSEVLHDHVRNVEIEQGFIQRILGTGSIGISSAGQDDIEIQVKDIPNPYKVKELIDLYREM